jgi:RNA polymerase sigma-70 factor, ECF subfamily
MRAALAIDGGLENHRRELNAYCGRMLGSHADAEDAVQETLLRAWRAADGFRGHASARTWLYRIATNVCIDAAKRRSRQPVPVGGWDDLSDWGSGPDPADLVLIREEARGALAAVADRLSPRQRDVLLLRDVLCLHAAEVAELLDTSVVAVNSALQRARANAVRARTDESRPAYGSMSRDLNVRTS